MVIPAKELPSAEQEVICDAIYKRARILARAGEECIALRDQEMELDNLVRDGEAYFARVEFLGFCLSKRYRLTPLNVANAVAGLPFIGCRHSTRRCRQWPEDSDGLSYGIFRILERIVSDNVRRSDLLRDTDKWLEARRPKGNAYAIADLRENRYYLRRSIRAALEQGPESRSIARCYFERVLETQIESAKCRPCIRRGRTNCEVIAFVKNRRPNGVNFVVTNSRFRHAKG